MSVEVVVVGSSAAALSAIEHFRRYDLHSRVTLITRDGEEALGKMSKEAVADHLLSRIFKRN